MKRGHGVGIALEFVVLKSFRSFDVRAQHLQRVDHDVAHQLNPRPIDSFAHEVLVGIHRGGLEVVEDAVGDFAVDLLGHAHIEAPDARRKVCDGDSELLGGYRASHGGVHVSYHHGQVRPVIETYFFILDHGPADGLGMSITPYSQVNIRLGYAQVGKKGVAHVRVVVLSGVDDDRLEFRVFPHLMVQRCNFHKIRPRGGDEMYFHGCS